jgi:hypothetical protein
MMKNNGIISGCSTSGCWETLGTTRCCQFQQGNYIVLYPGELEAAWAAGQSTAHLKIIDGDYHGGQKAVCNAKCTASCDGGFKPLDCASYPFFPAPPSGGEVGLLLKGQKCPLVAEHHQEHAAAVKAAWNLLIRDNPAVGPWLDKVRLVGYTEPPRRVDQPEVVEFPAVA